MCHCYKKDYLVRKIGRFRLCRRKPTSLFTETYLSGRIKILMAEERAGQSLAEDSYSRDSRYDSHCPYLPLYATFIFYDASMGAPIYKCLKYSNPERHYRNRNFNWFPALNTGQQQPNCDKVIIYYHVARFSIAWFAQRLHVSAR